MLIDTHCHLTYPGLAETQEQVVAAAAAAGVERMITIGTHPPDHGPAIAAAELFPAVFAAIGIHPHYAADAPADVGGALEGIFRQHPKLLAVGECGLDYHYGHDTKEAQQRVFLEQVALARSLHLPLILHVRDAHADAAAIMRANADLPFVVHCFTGTEEECRAWAAMGAYIGITGIVTYNNAPNVRAACRAVPADRLLVETDAPYLSPQPVRKIKVNQPAHVAHVARYVAELRGVSLVDLAAATTANAARLFGSGLVA